MKIKERLLENHILAVSIGVIYLWFGGLKFFPQFSPAEDIAKHTIDLLTFGVFSAQTAIILLAVWETLIGLMFLLNIYRRWAVIIALVHMLGTFAPLFLFPEQSFTSPFCFTLLGQYIVKNIVIVSALFTLYKIPDKTIQVKEVYLR